MKNIVIVAALFVLSVTIVSCSEKEDSCAAIACVQYVYELKFKLVDSVDNDLLSGSNPKYQPSDISVFHKQDTSHTQPIPIQTIQAGQDITLKSFAPVLGMVMMVDTTRYILDFGFEKVDCCTQRVKTLSIDSVQVCGDCPEIVRIPVR